MNTYIHKAQDKERSVVNAVSEKQGHAVQFVDSRPEAVRMKTLQGLASNSKQAKAVAQLQVMADSYSALQQRSLQKPHRVKPAMQLKSGVYINDDKALEAEADVMGTKALQMKSKDYSTEAGIENSSFRLQSPVAKRESPVQRVINIGGDDLQGDEGVKRLLTDNNLIPGTVNSIKGYLGQLHEKKGDPYTTFRDVTLKIYDLQDMPYVGIVNRAAVDLRMANPDKEFRENYLETGEMSVHKGLAQLGIRNAGDLNAWFVQHDAELNLEIERVYQEMDQGTALNFGMSLEELPGHLKQPKDTRKGLCGQTSNALLRYLASKYPALYEIGRIQQQGGEQHQFLIFTNGAIETVLLDPTYRQFDDDGEWSEESHIWVGPPEAHPFPKETENRKGANKNLKLE